MTGFSYPEVGGTGRGRGELPVGYHHQHKRVAVGRGAVAFRAAADGIMTFEMHRRVGLRPRASAARAAAGVTVVSHFGPLAAPCRVVWAEQTERRAGFGYGTLPGHPERGEEAFVVSLDHNGVVWFEVIAFSRPAVWYTRLAGPVGRALQGLITRRYVAAVRALSKLS